MTREEAIAMLRTGTYYYLTNEQIVRLFCECGRCFCPMDTLWQALEDVLGRPVFIHEFGRLDALKAEFEGRTPKRTLTDIVGDFPPEKLLVIET